MLSLSRLVAINSVVAGLEIAASVAFTFIPPLLLKAGFSETAMSIVMGVAPFVALVTVGGLGRWSDSCTSKWGRRKPFITALSVLLVISLFLLYLGQVVISMEGSKHAGMLVLAVGVILLDYASQAAINPCEALVSDLMVGMGGVQDGFTVYSGMLSVGACLGYLLTALDWKTMGISLGTKEQTALVIVLFLYLGCLAITLVAAKERPFSGSDLYQSLRSDTDICAEETRDSRACESCDCDISRQKIKRKEDDGYKILDDPGFKMRDDPGYVSGEEEEGLIRPNWPRLGRSRMTFRGCRPLRACKEILLFSTNLCLKVISLPFSVYQTIHSAPAPLRSLFVADWASWIAIMAHAMFYTDFVATAVYGGQPDAPPGSVHDLLFDEGVRMGSWGLLLHSITACLYAVLVQEHVTKLIGLKRSYQFGLGMFSLSMAATVLLSSSLTVLNIASALSGIGYAVITTIPNSLVTTYHQHPALYYGLDAGKAGLGADIAILDSGYYLSQICLSLVMGSIVEMTGLPHYYMIVACISGLAATFLADKVVFDPQDLKNQSQNP